jgi:AP endonuclease-2
VLVTPGLLPWIKASDIQPSIKGSDHCPVFVDLHDEITSDAGEKLVLRDLMHMRKEDAAAKREPPRLAAKYWPEFQGKQMLVSSFFTKRGAETVTKALPAIARSAQTTAPDLLDVPPISAIEPPSASQVPQTSASTQPATEPSPPPPPSLTPPPSSQTSAKPPQTSHSSRKRPRPPETSKPKRLRTGQSKLSSFFNKPPSSTPATKSSPPEIVDLCEDDDEVPSDAPLPTITSDIRPPSSSQDINENSKRAASWSALFTPVPPPLCTVHGEPAKSFRVNKPGPNKGRTFYLCARPVGPGYDKGRSERLREEVNHQYKCDFFKWASDVKREAMRSSTGGAADGSKV